MTLGKIDTTALLADLTKGRDKRAAADPVRAEFDRHIETVKALVEAARRPFPSIMSDGPNAPSDQRVWLAYQLCDSRLSEDEAFSAVAFHPNVTDQWRGR